MTPARIARTTPSPAPVGTGRALRRSKTSGTVASPRDRPRPRAQVVRCTAQGDRSRVVLGATRLAGTSGESLPITAAGGEQTRGRWQHASVEHRCDSWSVWVAGCDVGAPAVPAPQRWAGVG